MEVKFRDLRIGDKFICHDIEFIKISYTKSSSKRLPLSRRPTNAINMSNQHQMVFGDNVLCSKIE